MTRVKICGVRDAETAREAVKAGADFIGLMFAESRRQVTPQQCYDIIEVVRETRRSPDVAQIEGPGRGEVRGASWFGAWNEAIDDALARWRPLIVGVFADQEVEDANEIAEAAGLELIQLSGGEDESFVRQIRPPVLKAIHVHPETTAEDVVDTATPGVAAGIMLDTGSASARGGTGETFDWEVAAEVGRRLPLMLAGGLDPANVAAAVGAVDPWAVDVSSGVETDGDKDIEKVRAFIRAAKGTGR
ncbi:MAG: phosphoribosylanthranilate isomerase [Dehalococcoidia bacterium]|nr:phosphoribosylanthranilate isomerase [Dehalococcoidia bacterium]